MNSKHKILAPVIAALLLVPASLPANARASSPEEAAGPPLYAGSAKMDITPAVGTPLSGYGKLRGKETAGVHDPLYARATALSDGESIFLFLSLDLCLIDKNLRRGILEKIHEQYSLPEGHFIISATHTHSGAGAIGKRFWQRFIMGKFDREIFENLTARAADAGLRALQELRPVTAEYGEADIEDLVENRMVTENRYPVRLKVLRFLAEEGHVQAMMVFMAAHPTLFPAETLQFSADYPGQLLDLLEKAHPEATAIFINGAAGDTRPRIDRSANRVEEIKSYAETLAARALEISYGPVPLNGSWKTVLNKPKLPNVKVRVGPFRVPSFIGNRFFPRQSYFQAVRLGPLLFLTFPGELSSEIGHEIESRARRMGFMPFMVGYAHDYITYVVPRRYYSDRSHYESRVSFYGEEAEWFVQEEMDGLMEQVLTKEEKKTFLAPGYKHAGKDGPPPVLFLQGPAYHRGYEEGRLMKEEIQEGMNNILKYFRGELRVPLLNRLIIRFVGNRAWNQLEPHISYEEHQQIKGIADGAGVSLGTLRRIHAMPELFPTLCANGAYWGQATADGNLIAIRNLDWNRQMGVQYLATLKYTRHPGGPDYVNIGYSGFAGVLSGVNEHGISVGQIGATSADETMEGVPMPFLLKRVLKESASLEDASRLFARSRLTQGYHYVIADALRRDAVAIEATANHIAFFRDGDPRDKEIEYALDIENALFRGDTALDPLIRSLQWASGGNPETDELETPRGSAYEVRYLKQGRLVLENYGRITAATAKEIAAAIAPGSNIQSVVYAFPDFWVANARGELRAVDSGFHHFNFHELSNSA